MVVVPGCCVRGASCCAARWCCSRSVRSVARTLWVHRQVAGFSIVALFQSWWLLCVRRSIGCRSHGPFVSQAFNHLTSQSSRRADARGLFPVLGGCSSKVLGSWCFVLCGMLVLLAFGAAGCAHAAGASASRCLCKRVAFSIVVVAARVSLHRLRVACAVGVASVQPPNKSIKPTC